VHHSEQFIQNDCCLLQYCHEDRVYSQLITSFNANPLPVPSKCRLVIKIRREHDHFIPANGAFHGEGNGLGMHYLVFDVAMAADSPQVLEGSP